MFKRGKQEKKEKHHENKMKYGKGKKETEKKGSKQSKEEDKNHRMERRILKRGKKKQRRKKGEFQKAAQKNVSFSTKKKYKNRMNTCFSQREETIFHFCLTKYEEGENILSWWSVKKGNREDHFSKIFILVEKAFKRNKRNNNR